MRRAVFLDRDGVLNQSIIRNGKMFSPTKIEEFQIIESARASLEKLVHEGFLLIVVTNQPDIARGILSEVDLKSMHALLIDKMGGHEVIADIFQRHSREYYKFFL